MNDISYNYKLIRQIINAKSNKLPDLGLIFDNLAKRVMTRLDYIKLEPKVVIDCGSGFGYDYNLLKEKFHGSTIYEIDTSLEVLKTQQNKKSWLRNILNKSESRNLINADAYHIPIRNGIVDFVYANQLLPYLSDIVAYFKEARRVLKVGGAFCISGLGVDSFKELRELGLSTYRFPDMHDIGDMLVEVGFTNPVVDTEYITLEYDNLATLLCDIKLVGCGAANSEILRSGITKAEFDIIKSKLHQPIQLTLEIFVAHGWKDQHKIDLPTGYSPIKFSKNK